MDVNILVAMLKIRSMDMVSFLGQMEDNIKEIGKMANK